MEGLGPRLRRARRERDLTQQELAEQAGTTYQTINRIERGHTTPKVDTVAKLATALGVDLKWLAFGDEEKGGER
jgi:transcriptional regulator with XRE-family HTH domain